MLMKAQIHKCFPAVSSIPLQEWRMRYAERLMNECCKDMHMRANEQCSNTYVHIYLACDVLLCAYFSFSAHSYARLPYSPLFPLLLHHLISGAAFLLLGRPSPWGLLQLYQIRRDGNFPKSFKGIFNSLSLSNADVPLLYALIVIRADIMILLLTDRRPRWLAFISPMEISCSNTWLQNARAASHKS